MAGLARGVTDDWEEDDFESNDDDAESLVSIGEAAYLPLTWDAKHLRTND
jgi:hypothetical protein